MEAPYDIKSKISLLVLIPGAVQFLWQDFMHGQSDSAISDKPYSKVARREVRGRERGEQVAARRVVRLPHAQQETWLRRAARAAGPHQLPPDGAGGLPQGLQEQAGGEGQEGQSGEGVEGGWTHI